MSLVASVKLDTPSVKLYNCVDTMKELACMLRCSDTLESSNTIRGFTCSKSCSLQSRFTEGAGTRGPEKRKAVFIVKLIPAKAAPLTVVQNWFANPAAGFSNLVS